MIKQQQMQMVAQQQMRGGAPAAAKPANDNANPPGLPGPRVGNPEPVTG